MPLFRRKPLHERLARQGVLDAQEPQPVDTTPRWGEAGIHGVSRPRRWDAVVMAQAPDLQGDSVQFVVLSDGSVLLDEEIPEEAVEPIVEEFDELVEPTYRVEAVRRHEDVWAAAAKRIEVAELPNAQGEELSLTMQDGSRTLLVDGRPEFGSVPALERIAGERYESYVALGTRLDADLWEVRITPL
ncbi:MAG TPA: hypothetical protein VF895_00370 [Gaiellaceae bacterium]